MKKHLFADTNIFLRFLTNDIPVQAQKVRQRFIEAQAGEYQILVLHITIVEILFQLENWYKLSRVEASLKLMELLNVEWLQVENKYVVLEALKLYPYTKIDFVDLLTWTTAKLNTNHILSFDRDFDKLDPEIRMEP